MKIIIISIVLLIPAAFCNQNKHVNYSQAELICGLTVKQNSQCFFMPSLINELQEWEEDSIMT